MKMSPFGRPKRLFDDGRLRRFKRRKGGSVVSDGLPAIGSTPITFGRSDYVHKRALTHRRGMSFTSSGAWSSGGGWSSGVARRRRFSGRAALACLALALVAVGGAKFALPLLWTDGSAAGEGSDSQEPALVLPVQKAALADATERTGEDGVVYGTTSDGVTYELYGRGCASVEPGKVTLVAAGDQVGSAQALELADSWLGSTGDGAYDFWPFYREIAPVVDGFDIAYVNQETVMAGTEKFPYSGYPTFNTPSAAAEAIAEAGFDVVGFGSNHVYDLGEYGASKTHEVWNEYAELMVVGSYESQEQRDRVHLVERGGAVVAFLQYCYGDNYLGSYENFPNGYQLCGFDKDAIRADVERARSLANAVVVVMHWGTEYQSAPDDQQLEYARFLADLDVDLVLGSHAHVTQPIRYVTGESGKTVPVVFGMSDLVSGWDKIDAIMSGLFTCTFTFDEDGDAVLSELAWHPAVEWSDGEGVYVRLLADMEDAEVNANTRVGNCEGLYSDHIKGFYEELGMEVPVVWEAGVLQGLASDGFSAAAAVARSGERALATGSLLVSVSLPA